MRDAGCGPTPLPSRIPHPASPLMPFVEAVRLALATIRVQKLKSFFATVGVTIGVTFLIAVVTIVSGMGRYMKDEVVGKVMTVNSFELRHRPYIDLGGANEDSFRIWRRRPRLHDYDVEPVLAVLPPGVIGAVESTDQIRLESRWAKPVSVRAEAVSEQWFEIKKMAVTKGRLPSPQEFALGSPVIVVGQDVADHFFKGVEPIGKELKVAGIPYQVIGVAEKQGSAFGISFDRFIVAPHRAPLNRLLNVHGVIDGIIIQAPSRSAMYEAMENVRQLMRSRHKLRPAQPDDFSFTTSESALAFWSKIQGYLVIAGVALPAIGLVVGAIVIMNIMLVAVAERTREIGIRKSLGARRRDILWQFLVESATLSTVGAAVGIALGIGLAQLIRAVTPLPAAVELWSVVVAVILGAGVGIIAGVYPASRAARLDPIAALRQE